MGGATRDLFIDMGGATRYFKTFTYLCPSSCESTVESPNSFIETGFSPHAPLTTAKPAFDRSRDPSVSVPDHRSKLNILNTVAPLEPTPAKCVRRQLRFYTILFRKAQGGMRVL